MDYPELENTTPVEFGKQFVSFVQGERDDDRISIKYYQDQSLGTVYAEVIFGRLAQGPPGHAHGGAISAVFDELMGACCWLNGYPAMTAQFTTRFFKPVPLNIPLLFSARIKARDGSKIQLRAILLNQVDQRYATARGLFISQDIQTFERMSGIKSEKFPQSSAMQIHKRP